jgi:hypothetical protein
MLPAKSICLEMLTTLAPENWEKKPQQYTQVAPYISVQHLF